jgi:hypothetical protein
MTVQINIYFVNVRLIQYVRQSMSGSRFVEIYFLLLYGKITKRYKIRMTYEIYINK